MKSRNFIKFIEGKLFFRKYKFPSWCKSIVIFFPKRYLVSNVNVYVIWTQYFVQNVSQLVILRHMGTGDWDLNKCIDTWYTFILCLVISKSHSSVVESSLRNSWIGVLNLGENYFHFQYRVEWIYSENNIVNLVPLR